MNKKEELRKEWAAKVAEFRASGQTTTEWCAARGIKPSKLRYWLRKYKDREQPTAQWLPVEVHELPSNGLLVRVGKASIEVRPGYDRELLLDIVKTLQPYAE